ncbi:hypothetical protein O181_085281 [Austropuccinia psidii MF-1]|uniref:Uncharacterized protein n=1 Tax=Austropuccinia psidii MF-1 TaxID=1389203 RepID=A0A9Q3FSL0_9BASI|nr:hypothetical protein [Austropuccinia psidii MF-1]
MLKRASDWNMTGEIHGTLMKKAHETQKLVGSHEAVRKVIEKQVEVNKMGKELIQVNNEVYSGMLEILRRNGLQVRDGADFPHPLGQWVLSQFANPIRSIEIDHNKGRASVLPPNNAIIFRHNNAIKYGLVKDIYNFHAPHSKVQPGIHVLLIHIRFNRPCYPPGHKGSYLALLGVVIGQIQIDSFLMINPSDIISLAAYWLIESETFQVPFNGIMMCPFNRELVL